MNNEELITAICAGEISEVEKLIDQGIDVNGTAELENQSLFTAAQFDEDQIALLLIKSGADVNAREKWHNNTPLHKAASYGSTKVVKVLLEKGADPNLVNKQGDKPLDLSSNVAISKLLALTDEDVKSIDESKSKAEEIIKVLKEKGYFKYVSNKDLETVISNTIDNFVTNGTLSGGFDEDTLEAFNPRQYMTDAEDLAEAGIGSVIEVMKPTLEKMNVKIENCEDNYPRESGYTLSINGKSYTVFDEEDEDPSWQKAHKRLLEIVSQLLEETGSDERLYGQYSNNDTQSIFLTPDLYDYINSLDKIDPGWEPTPSDLL